MGLCFRVICLRVVVAVVLVWLGSGTVTAQPDAEKHPFPESARPSPLALRHLDSLPNRLAMPDSRFGFDADSYRWRHARGRAYLSTMVPLLGSGIVLRIGDEIHDDEWGATHTAGFCVLGAGLLVGPSMGQWCVGDSRRAWLGTSIRGGGILGMIAGVRLAVEQTEDDGLGAILTAPVKIVAYSLPGFFVMMFGVGWSLDRTPDRLCGTESEKVALRPAAITVPGGRVASGLSLRLRF
jgi:hypothetical protein